MAQFKKYKQKISIYCREIEEDELSVVALEDAGISFTNKQLFEGHPMAGDQIAYEEDTPDDLFLLSLNEWQDKYEEKK